MLKRYTSKIEYTAYTACAFLVVTGLVLASVNLKYFEDSYTTEDGPIESLTPVCLLICALLCSKRLSYWWKRKDGRKVLSMLILMVLCLFGAGEEISWGQRIYDIPCPEYFKTHNAQAELNIHNLVVEGVKINKLVFSNLLGAVWILFLFLLPALYVRTSRVRTFCDRWAIPVPRLAQIIVYSVLAGLTYSIRSDSKFELGEFLACTFLLLISWRPFNSHILPESRSTPRE